MNIFIGTRLELEPEVPLATEQKLVGAFKGGFTAGFENTVGSAQGWAPRQFISGRKGADYSQPQRITDFMDHEDMEEFGAKKIMEEDFESLGSTAKELERRKLMASGLSSVDDLITYENPIGEEILRRLLAETPTKKIPKIVMQEPALHIIAAIGTDSSNNTKGRGFSQRKNDEGMPTKNERFPKKGSKKLERGILLLDSDDDVIYESAPLSFNFQSDDLNIKDHDFTNFQSASKLASKENSLSKNAPPGFKEGITIASGPKMISATPLPPRDFVASPAFLRASNLNHPTIKGLNKNISCYISAKNEARLKSLISRTNAKSTDNASMKDSLEIHTVPTKVAQGALLGFKPFGNDLEKQARYTAFLQNIIDKSESNEPMQTSTKKMTEQEAAETREFSKAAMLYRPLAEMMSQRFTSKVEVPAVAKKVEKVFGPDTTRSVTKWQPAKTLCQRFAVRYVEDSDLEDEEDRNIEPLNAETMAVLVKERDAMLERGDANNMLEEVPQTEILTKDELLAELHAGFDMMKNNDAEAIEKPGMELFEAIFAESDNEEFEPLPMDTSDIKAPTKVSSSSKEIDANEYFSSKASFSSTVIQKIAPSESSVRPMFKKPKNVKSAGTEKKRKPKMTALSFDPEEEVEQPNVATSKKPKVRPSAADYM